VAGLRNQSAVLSFAIPSSAKAVGFLPIDAAIFFVLAIDKQIDNLS
jgi:hypothetical protein